ncbi:hypothetical protein GCM10010402_71590 [Actinomadura luteofluorescens]|uniref:hypothetical protein n=1 Tax=Actinomadura luteofluorescens TaxID=46163 RepID=UPI002164E14A|nr:hypothetical protein [Actinomadura glauciflava]MCR3745834.1 hypothetical protein [Actinomadura glauciflava]
MSITAEQAVTAAGSPRELLDGRLFDTLSAYVARRQEVTLAYAERMVEQMLVWLKAVADNPQVRLAMDESVDPAWHAFILHSQDYAEFCERMYGRYLHHVPPGLDASMSREEVERTMPALHATGYLVDAEFWVGAKPCCPPNPCVVSVGPKA